jgi:hypothetical protein
VKKEDNDEEEDWYPGIDQKTEEEDSYHKCPKCGCVFKK